MATASKVFCKVKQTCNNVILCLIAMTDVCLRNRGDTNVEKVLPGRANCENKAVMVRELVQSGKDR